MFSKLAACTALVVLPRLIFAQCRDGTPPPCGRSGVSAGIRPDPPLDDRTWLVLPFHNVARSMESDWLHDGSVNLLAGELSQWRDVRVIPERRVADLVRSSAAGRRNESIPLADAMSIARRAGAGRLVMGEFIQVGATTRIGATVFDVRRGTGIRSTREEGVSADSLMPVFRRIARNVLNVAPFAGGTSSTGTSRVDAFREYVTGNAALNRFDIAEARLHYLRALTFDSAFALPHYKLAWATEWDDQSNSDYQREHAEAAARLGTSLPQRDRELIRGLNAFSRNEPHRACEIYQALINADSSDIEALFGLGECSYHDLFVERLPSDTVRLRFRGSWNTAARAFQRVLELDPTFHAAFRHILDILTTETRFGLLEAEFRPLPNADNKGLLTGRTPPYRAWVLRDGDTVMTVPAATGPGQQADLDRQAAEYRRTGAKRRNLERAYVIAQAWVDAAPDEGSARAVLGHILLKLGRPMDAAWHLDRGVGVSLGDNWRLFHDRVEVAIKLDRIKEVQPLVDSVTKGRLMNNDISALFGRLRVTNDDWDQMASWNEDTSSTASRLKREYAREARRVFVGAGNAHSIEVEGQFLAGGTPGMEPNGQLGWLPTILLGLRLPRVSWPALEYLPGPRITNLVAAMARGDTARVRVEAARLDSLSTLEAVARGGLYPAVIAVDAYLVVADSMSALRLLRGTLDTSLVTMPIFETHVARVSAANGVGWPTLAAVLPRAMLLRADLEAAVGRKESAHTWYRRFIELWVNADPDLQPIVERAKAAYARTPGRT